MTILNDDGTTKFKINANNELDCGSIVLVEMPSNEHNLIWRHIACWGRGLFKSGLFKVFGLNNECKS